MITIIDYQAGNLKSLCNALSRQGFETTITTDPETILKSPLVILPGVGAFGDAAAALEERGLKDALLQRSALGKPILGICLGMQLLYENSDESNTKDFALGLGLLKGNIRRLSPENAQFKVPHMGWNQLEKSPFTLPELESYEGQNVYFVHSYGLVDQDEAQIQFYSDHGQRVPALVYSPPVQSDKGISKGSLMGFQFHPEKSGPEGEKLLAAAIALLMS